MRRVFGRCAARAAHAQCSHVDPRFPRAGELRRRVWPTQEQEWFSAKGVNGDQGR